MVSNLPRCGQFSGCVTCWRALIALAIIGAFTPAALAADPIMRPGAWEYVVIKTARVPHRGMKRDMGTIKTTYCMTIETLAADPLSAETIRRRGGTCTSPAVKQDGPIERWSMDCSMHDGKKVRFAAEMQKSPEHLRATMVMTIFEPDGPAELVMAGTATFKGQCTPDMPSYPGLR